MTKYRVPVEMKFNGAVFVDANDEQQAEEIVIDQMCGKLESIYAHGHPAIDNWVFDVIGRVERRDNESIEEVEEL